MSDVKVFTLEDLQAHKSREDLYLLISGKVYDATQFLDEHPGGDEVLLEEAGRDGTEAFEDVGHSDEARDMLVKMFVGNFDGPTKSSAKASAGGSTTTSSSSGTNPLLFVVLAGVGAFLAWRLFLA
ncbi:uncharacterized protein EHS24_006047 [Apiotrichum porosum]|uniref:Cytochrome b5 heme-binding domain-containing protein n=1 Tax=Apiotrichum porosum TaxID=105984 RepID=A0A427Y0J4_9TREE|nr:uncharacterized protein EHS24_006047 [Apiotrichum porosum]RSH84525.1 hypothetical protein EHS24_006047 [Apiotrichum porosum]